MNRTRTAICLAFAAVAAVLTACTNNPYPPAQGGKNYLYSTFGEPPKHLDPAIAYSEDQYAFMQQIYEPVVQYHFLKRPYQLVALTATEVPAPQYFDKAGRPLPADASDEAVAKAVYTIRIRPGIKYQNHAGFARDASGSPLYLNLKDADLAGIEDAEGFPNKDTRELTAADYVWEIKRLAHPLLQCPILSILQEYVEGFEAYSTTLKKEIEAVRAERRRAVGALYNRERDELEHPIFLDLDNFDFPGVQLVDRFTFRVVLSKKYPQMRYWFAMPFFAPVPKEVDRFYAQGPLAARRITMDTNPIGTGPYRMERFSPNEEIILTRNENFHGETYPAEGEPGDFEAGHLADAGKQLPFIDKAIYKKETEALPRWGKFLQGYFDYSGIVDDVFGQAVAQTPAGLGASEAMLQKGIKLSKAPQPSLYYFNFNMLDPVVGGYEPAKKKLRQAIAIAIDSDENIEIFRNGRDRRADNILPPGIFGFSEGKDAVNPFIDDWDEKAGKAKRKPVDAARRLLAEAGYPGGRDSSGKPLVIFYDNYRAGPESKSYLDWMRKQLARIDIDLETRNTDYNRFQDKVNKGNFQMIDWGWNADYPDPENFMFLLYGPNSKVKSGSENNANYDNPQFNALFRQMATMENSPDRFALIQKMNRIVQEDMPWIPSYNPVDFALFHRWYQNTKEMPLGGLLKYRKIDPKLRQTVLAAENRPRYWPFALVIPIVALLVVPAWIGVARKQKRSAIS